MSEAVSHFLQIHIGNNAFFPRLAYGLHFMQNRENVCAQKYPSMEEELNEVSDRAGMLHYCLRLWIRQAKQNRQDREVVSNVISTIDWLNQRTPVTIDNLHRTYYLSNLEVLGELEETINYIEGRKINSLSNKAIPMLVTDYTCIALPPLILRLKEVVETARCTEPQDALSLSEWMTSMSKELKATDEDKASYANEVNAIVASNTGHSRLSALQFAASFELEKIRKNHWGNLYLSHRGNIAELVKAVSQERGNHQGEALDKLIEHARKYEWLVQEMEQEQRAHGLPDVQATGRMVNITNHSGGVVQVTDKILQTL